MTTRMHKNWKFLSADNHRNIIVSGASGAVFAQDKYPKPDFSAMEEYYEIVEYKHDFTDRQFRIIVKP